MKRTLTALMATGALALNGCEEKRNYNQYESVTPLWVPSCDLTPGYDITFDSWGSARMVGNTLRIGKMNDPENKVRGFNEKYPLLIAVDQNRDGVFDSVEFINGVKEGDPIEMYADRKRLHEIVDKLIESQRK